MKRLNLLTDYLMQALPYVRKFENSLMVIKYGGNAIKNKEVRESIVKDVVLMRTIGICPIIVHGGGSYITETLNKMGKETIFEKGLRVTDAETAKIAEMVLSGKVNKEIVDEFRRYDIKAVGISGKDGHLFLSKPKDKNLGFVGEIEKVDPSIIFSLVESGFVPVISTIGFDKDGNTYNINADYAAMSLAMSLKAKKLIFLTDVLGIMKDINSPETLIGEISLNEIDKLIKNEIIIKGMIPKSECAKNAILAGVEGVHIIKASTEHNLLLELFTDNGIGTMIRK